LLNWQAVPFVHEVLAHRPESVPFVWHFKEGPFICLEKGTWSQLADLYLRSQGQIYISEDMRGWFKTVLPQASVGTPTLLLDGDLPKREWFTSERSPRLSELDGEIHTVVPGRPIGLHPHNVGELAAEGVDLRRAIWDDLNYPARISTLAAAGLPLIQFDNAKACVATQSLSRRLGVGLFGTSIEEVATRLRDRPGLAALQERMWAQRMTFTFDHHADSLVGLFRQVIELHRS
jgi:hypothetical protein